jgi:hypothetical protein
MTAVVSGGVFIDLDKNNVLIGGMLGDPVSVDEYFLPAHVVSSPGVGGWTAEGGYGWPYGRRDEASRSRAVRSGSRRRISLYIRRS